MPLKLLLSSLVSPEPFASSRFGPGPYYVTFELKLPMGGGSNGDGSSRTTINKITVEMAPLNLMPYTVHIFLQQIHRKLWDGTEIFRMMSHIFVAHPYIQQEGKDMWKMRDVDLEKLQYREYNNNFPHAKHTLGLAGNPPGPNFYINRNDNSHHNDMSDPCFAKVIRGEGVIERMSSLPTAEDGATLERPVVIVSAYVSTNKGLEKNLMRQV